MNKTQREQWDMWINAINKQTVYAPGDELLVQVNKHILVLERELHALKNKKSVAALLMKKV
jgi:hypothetical protein